MSEMVARVVRAMDIAEHKVIRNSEGVDIRVARARAAIEAMRPHNSDLKVVETLANHVGATTMQITAALNEWIDESLK